jgi:hypothetical protein
MSKLHWEEEAWVSIDGATFAFADPSVVNDRLRARVLGNDTAELPIIGFNTGADLEVPIEVVFDESRTILAIRMCVTDDVDDLDGTWVPVGELTVGDSGCVALDPTRPAEPRRYMTFPLPAGTYVAEVFEWTDDEVTDQLALRLRRPDMSPAELELPQESDGEDVVVADGVEDADATMTVVDNHARED